MKKIDAKMLNVFYLSDKNSVEIKTLVKDCVNTIVFETPTHQQCLSILQELGLLKD